MSFFSILKWSTAAVSTKWSRLPTRYGATLSSALAVEHCLNDADLLTLLLCCWLCYRCHVMPPCWGIYSYTRIDLSVVFYPFDRAFSCTTRHKWRNSSRCSWRSKWRVALVVLSAHPRSSCSCFTFRNSIRVCFTGRFAWNPTTRQIVGTRAFQLTLFGTFFDQSIFVHLKNVL